MKHIKKFNNFLKESKKTPKFVTDTNYLPSKLVSDAFGLDLYTDYKFPYDMNADMYRKNIFDISDKVRDMDHPIFKTMLEDLIKLNPELEPLKNVDPWSVLMGVVSHFTVEDIEYFCKTGGLMYIHGKEKDQIEKAFSIIKNKIPDYKSGWIPSPLSVQKILKVSQKEKSKI
jgi:hypothetical protein